jgi:hypothetical protein
MPAHVTEGGPASGRPCVGDVAGGEVEYMCRQGGPADRYEPAHRRAAVTRFASGYPTSMHGFDDVFLKDTTTRRIVLGDSTGPLVIVRSASDQWLGAAAPAPPPLGGPPACAGAAKPSVAAASTNPAANVPDGFMILQLLKAFGCRDTIQFGTLRLISGDMLCARRPFEKTPDGWA